MTWLHKFFGLFFIPANGQAKSAQQLISTVLPFHPLYFTWFCSKRDVLELVTLLYIFSSSGTIYFLKKSKDPILMFTGSSSMACKSHLLSQVVHLSRKHVYQNSFEILVLGAAFKSNYRRLFINDSQNSLLKVFKDWNNKELPLVQSMSNRCSHGIFTLKLTIVTSFIN